MRFEPASRGPQFTDPMPALAVGLPRVALDTRGAHTWLRWRSAQCQPHLSLQLLNTCSVFVVRHFSKVHPGCRDLVASATIRPANMPGISGSHAAPHTLSSACRRPSRAVLCIRSAVCQSLLRARRSARRAVACRAAQVHPCWQRSIAMRRLQRAWGPHGSRCGSVSTKTVTHPGQAGAFQCSRAGALVPSHHAPPAADRATPLSRHVLNRSDRQDPQQQQEQQQQEQGAPAPLRDLGPDAALTLAWHAAQNRSLFAAHCFVDTVLEAYRRGCPCDDLEVGAV